MQRHFLSPLIFLAGIFLMDAAVAGALGEHAAKQILSAMDCGDRLISVAQPPSVADQWLHRWMLRHQNSIPESSPTVDYSTVYTSPSFHPARAEALRQAVHSIWSKENRLDRRMRAAATPRAQYLEMKDLQGRLQNERYRTLARYLAGQGTGSLFFTQNEHSPWVLILPGGAYALAPEINSLYNLHGTLTVACEEIYSRYSAEENTLYLPWRIALSGELTERERQLIERIKSHRVSEIEIGDGTRPELGAFLFDPENAVPDSLRFITYAQDSAPGKQDGYRFSFRTGSVGALDAGLAEKLQRMQRLHMQSGQGVLAVGLRSAAGEWAVSFPEEFSLAASTYSFQDAFEELLPRLRPRLSPRQMGLPDLFLFVAGRPQFTALDIEDLKSFTGNQEVGINSLSYVLINSTAAQGPLYFIHTIDAVHASDTTVYADQLLKPFDRARARAQYSRLGVLYDPFSIRP